MERTRLTLPSPAFSDYPPGKPGNSCDREYLHHRSREKLQIHASLFCLGHLGLGK